MDTKQHYINPEHMRKIIQSTTEPLLIQKIIKTDLLSWTLADWDQMIKDDILTFRCGKFKFTKDPQFETTCSYKKAAFKEFLDYTNNMNPENWWYFDYKYLQEWFTDKMDFRNKIDWSLLGFPEVGAKNSTIWIGSRGAHTSCHIDTYGCNIILQLYGRKLWLLFPPEQNLKPTRIPFEESSIYSSLNFFSPEINNFKGITHCHKVILEPGDVLIVPPKWWHYVENLETAISVNVWIPLPQDDFERIKESVATIFTRQMLHTKLTECESLILNPNMIEDMVDCNDALKIIEAMAQKLKTDKVLRTRNKSNEFDNVFVEEAITNHEFIMKIPPMKDVNFKEFLLSQSQRFNKEQIADDQKVEDETAKNLIEFLKILTDDEVLSLIAKKIIEKR